MNAASVNPASNLEAHRLSVLLDLRHPLAYLALGPTRALGESLDLPIHWLPLPTRPLSPPDPLGDDEDRGTRHRRHRADAIAREIETYAAGQALVLREPYRDGEVDAANQAWLWVQHRAPEALPSFLTALFRAYWSLEIDGASREPLAKLVDAAGADGAGYLEWSASEGPAALDAVVQSLRERGLFNVPAYVLDDDVFYGRQHLPMIRWILEGRTGPIPI